jgi:hypothetical protein
MSDIPTPGSGEDVTGGPPFLAPRQRHLVDVIVPFAA